MTRVKLRLGVHKRQNAREVKERKVGAYWRSACCHAIPLWVSEA